MIVTGWGSQVQGVAWVMRLYSGDLSFFWQADPDMILWYMQRCKSMQTQSDIFQVSTFLFLLTTH